MPHDDYGLPWPTDQAARGIGARATRERGLPSSSGSEFTGGQGVIGVRIPGFARRLAAAVAVIAATTTLGITSPAWAVEYPSWSDVLTARGNEQAKQAEITR